jgi:hypothetical protein
MTDLAAAEHEANREPEECSHEWVIYGIAPDGTEFCRCRKCKKEIEE